MLLLGERDFGRFSTEHVIVVDTRIGKFERLTSGSNPSFRGFKRIHRFKHRPVEVLLESKYLGIFQELQVPKKTV